MDLTEKTYTHVLKFNYCYIQTWNFMFLLKDWELD